MTDVSPTTTPTAAAAVRSGAQPSRADTLASDFDTFLTLLTAQIQHQDPLNPIDSTEFASQLATFSGVEQQVETNTLLTTLVSQNNASTMAQMADWVGAEVRVAAPAAFDGSPVTISPTPVPGAASAELVVYDALGAERSRLAIAATDTPFDWPGLDPAGHLLPSGVYSFEVQSFDSSRQLIDATTPEVYGPVVEARTGKSGVDLVLDGGIVVPSSDVTGVRSAN